MNQWSFVNFWNVKPSRTAQTQSSLLKLSGDGSVACGRPTNEILSKWPPKQINCPPQD